jgi:hypothetical protein
LLRSEKISAPWLHAGAEISPASENKKRVENFSSSRQRDRNWWAVIECQGLALFKLLGFALECDSESRGGIVRGQGRFETRYSAGT